MIARSSNINLLVAVTLMLVGIGAAIGSGQDIRKTNGAIRVDSGESVGMLTTTNGAIVVGDNAQATQISTTNGAIRIGNEVVFDSVRTTNGAISVGAGVECSGDLQTTNGGISVGSGSRIAGDVSTVNGSVVMTSTHVGGKVSTVSSSVDLGADSMIVGGVVIEGRRGFSFGMGNSRTPKVIVGPRTRVIGDMEFKREVELWVHDSASVGNVSGAEARRYSGDRPD